MERKETAMEIVVGIMNGMNITLPDLADYVKRLDKDYFDEMTKEDEEEKAWLDAEVRGKEAELRAKSAPKQIEAEMG